LERLTRSPVVLHSKGEFGEFLGGPTDIHLNQIVMELGGLIMLEDASMTFAYGRRYGLVGRNGIGKTTFLKHLAAKVLFHSKKKKNSNNNNQKPSKTFPGIPSHLQILHIEQEVSGSDVSVLNTVLKTDIERESLLQEEKAILAQEDSKDSGKLVEIYQRLQEIESDTAVSRASAILSGVHFFFF